MSAPVTNPGLSATDVVPYPDDLARQYRSAGLWAGRTIAQELRAAVDAFADTAAVVSSDQTLTYTELDRGSDRIAIGLRGLGLRPGERVLLQVTNQARAVVAWYGLLKAGLVPVATLPQHRRHEITEIARQCEPTAHLIEPGFPSHDLTALAAEAAAAQPSIRVLLTAGIHEPPEHAVSVESLLARDVDPVAARQEVERVQAAISPESLAVLQLSGGTTSVPKLIPRLHSEYWYNARAWAAAVEMKAGDCVAHLLPVVHNAGIVCAMHAAHSVGASVALCATDPGQLSAVARRHPVTHLLMTRAILETLHRAPGAAADIRRSLRVLTWADRALPGEVIDQFETADCRVGQMFGMGEGMCLGTPLDAPAEIRHQTQGARICALDEIRVLEPGTEQPVKTGTRGELCARGPYTIRGYFRAPDRNAEAFTSDGFYRTGDIVTEVRYGGESYYRLEDRIKDLISRGGEKVNAQEVEELLGRHPSVERAAVVAMPDERLGERACAFLVARPGARAPGLDEVRVFLEGLGVAKFKWPERIEVRDQLPLTNIHKVNKVALRREIQQILSRETKPLTRSPSRRHGG
jgi:2,3-dihydroxybenzoate-AMP ligase